MPNIAVNPKYAGRTSEKVLENIAVCWLQAVAPAPANLADIISRYNNLRWYADNASNPRPFEDEMDKLYDQLVESAELAQYDERIATAMPLQIRWDWAIDQWRRGVRA
jgi:hypothetical protein